MGGCVTVEGVSPSVTVTFISYRKVEGVGVVTFSRCSSEVLTLFDWLLLLQGIRSESR